MILVPSSDSLPDSLMAALADRDVSIWVRGTFESAEKIKALAKTLRLPWKAIFIENANPGLVQELETPDFSSMARRRGFVHIIDSDPSRINLPPRSLPVFLLTGRDGQSSPFERQLQRLTMLEELRRSGVRQIVVVGDDDGIIPKGLEEIWSTGFRPRLIVVDKKIDSQITLSEWLEKNGQGYTSSIISLSVEVFADKLSSSFNARYTEEHPIIRLRGEKGDIHQIDLSGIDDLERPIFESYELILDRDFAVTAGDDISEEVFNAFFRGERDWRAFAAGLPWTRSDNEWSTLLAQLRRLDSAGESENSITYIVSEPGAGATTLARYLAFMAARSGYPTLLAKEIPFTPDALPLINLLTRAKQRNEEIRLGGLALEGSDERSYETPWLLVFDRIHWESRDTDLRRFLQQFTQAGRPVCILVVTGPQRDLSFYDSSRFKQVAELTQMISQNDALELGRHLNRYLRNFGKERPEWQWLSFQESHSVRYLEGLSCFWVTLSFWLQNQCDISDSLQEVVYREFKQHTDTPEIKRAVLQIAALSSMRLPMPESLIEQGDSPWPIHLLLEDRRFDFSPLGLVCVSNFGRKYWAMAHDILGVYLINALFYDYAARSALGFADARDALHLRFLILRELSSKPILGEADEREYGEEFATTVFKIDPDHGRGIWIQLWREVLSALDSMPVALRDGSRVFRHHTAISRRRIAWLDKAAYGISDFEKESLLRRAIEDINFALQMIDGKPDDEPDINLYNSLANAYFDLARVRANQGAAVEELIEWKKLASAATRQAYQQNPSSPYVIETHVKNLIASAEEATESTPGLCIEALEVVYAAIQEDHNDLRRRALTVLADKAVEILLSVANVDHQRKKSNSPIDVLIDAWIMLAKSADGHAPTSLNIVPDQVLQSVLKVLESPEGAGNPQVAKLRYQVLVSVAPLDFDSQLMVLNELVATDYRLSPQLRLEYALLLFQKMRTEEANREFKSLRRLWRDTDIYVHVPSRLRWLYHPGGTSRYVVNAVSAYGHGQKAMAKVREFGQIVVPYRPQEFDVREHQLGTKFSAYVSFGHNGPFLRPVSAHQH